jgi:hypothetical protein
MVEPSTSDNLPPISPGPKAGAAPPGAPSAPAPTFPGLEILEETAPGVGGMGRVYRARDVSLDCIVAVKTVKEHLLTPAGRAFFNREARAAARLKHPNIVRIYGFHPDHVPPYYVMEFVEGRPLDEACSGKPLALVVEILEKAARALAYAHSKGVVHRDIKPSNILVDFQDEPHLTDFGLAQKWDEVALGGTSGQAAGVGTPLFLAPELYLDDPTAAPTADVFALGVTMYRLLAGRYPFMGRTREEVRQAVFKGEPPLLQELNPAVPEPLQRICLKALEGSLEARYPSAQAVADDLRRFREGREVFARPTRYEAELRGKLQNHVTEIKMWSEHRLIDVPEMDRLIHPYRKLLDAEFPWHDLARRFPWETAMLRLGGWLVVVGTILWPFPFYWEKLQSHDRLLAVGAPTLLLNLVGWFFHRRKNRSTAFIFLSLGALLLPLFTGVLLNEYHLLRCPQSAARELFDDWGAVSNAKIADAVAEEAAAARKEGRAARPIDVPPTNMQLTLSMSALVGYLLLLLPLTRVRAFAFWTGLGVYFLFTTVLLQCGLKEWIHDNHQARVILFYIGLALAFLLLSVALEQRRRSEWAAAFYVFFPVPLVFCLTKLAQRGAVEWLGARGTWDEQSVDLWLMANGVVYLAAALWSARARSSHVRLWGNLFWLLVPASLLVPVDIQWKLDRGYEFTMIGKIGNGYFSSYEALSFLISVGFVVVGTRMRRYTLALSGLAGLAAFLYFATTIHFTEYLEWPLALTIGGGVAMAVAVLLVIAKARKRPQALM